MGYRAKVDKDRLQRTIAFLSDLLQADPVEGCLLVDQDAARLAIATCMDLKDPKSPMGDAMYDSFTPHATNIAVEGVCFRINAGSGATEVLLQPRPTSDTRHLGQMAVPGQAMRAADAGPEVALDRLTAVEFKVPTRYQFLGDVYVTNGVRGWYECKVHLAFPQGEPANAQWYCADPLPSETDSYRMVPSHREQIIPMALAAYKRCDRSK